MDAERPERWDAERKILRAFLYVIFGISLAMWFTAISPSERGKGENPTILMAFAVASASALILTIRR